ncbi:MAG: hypothetical protein ORN85_04410 [Sediminibacterium sp.]|nr:hypothetical protein [Sediminibacterium sp.]
MQHQNFNPKFTQSIWFSFFLLIMSFLLFFITVPFGLVYAIFALIFRRSFKFFGNFVLKIAIVLDILGNVTMQFIFNDYLITKDGHKFGEINETISSVLGKNQLMGTLKKPGKTLIKFLEVIEEEHCLNSIKYLDENQFKGL